MDVIANLTTTRPRVRLSVPRVLSWHLTICLFVGFVSATTGTDTLADSSVRIAADASPAARIQAAFDIVWETMFPIIPYVIGLLAIGRVVWMLRHERSTPEYPAYTWALSTIAAAVWLAVRSREVEVEPFDAEAVVLDNTEPIILMTFLGFWASFVADSRRFVKRQSLYFLLSVFVGGIAGLLIAALTFISEPKTVGANAVNEYEHRAGSLIPLTLSLATSAAYVLLKYFTDPELTDEETLGKEHDGFVAMQDLSARAPNGEEAYVISRVEDGAVSQQGAIIPHNDYTQIGVAAPVESFVLDDSIASDDGNGAQGDVGLMGIRV